jgi:hypothetical protein
MYMKRMVIPFAASGVFAAGLACGSGTVEGQSPGDCTDRADNDGDGKFDCDDDGCSGSPDCKEGAAPEAPAASDPAPKTVVVPKPKGPAPAPKKSEPSLTVTCAFADGWAAAIPAAVYKSDEGLMQKLIGLTEDPGFWKGEAGHLAAYAAKRCLPDRPLAFEVQSGKYYLVVGQANTFDNRGAYKNNGLTKVLDISGAASLSISAGDLTDTWLCISCPYVYVWNGVEFEYRTEVLVDVIGPGAEKSQRKEIGSVPVIKGVVRILLSEEQEEISHVDEIRLQIGGKEYSTTTKALADDDGRYLVLHDGESQELVFPVDLKDGEYPAAVVANGYYIPVGALR